MSASKVLLFFQILQSAAALQGVTCGCAMCNTIKFHVPFFTVCMTEISCRENIVWDEIYFLSKCLSNGAKTLSEIASLPAMMT